MDIEKLIRKICKYVDLERVDSEIRELATLLADPIQAMRSRYHFHKVPVDGIEYIVADAIALNRQMHQSGRGNLRYLFDKKTRELEGVAKEVDGGKYKKVA